MQRETISIQKPHMLRKDDDCIIFENAGSQLLRKLMRQYGNLVLHTVLLCADYIQEENRVPTDQEIRKLFSYNKPLQEKFVPLNAAFRQSAISAGCRMTFSIWENHSHMPKSQIANFIRRRAMDPEKLYLAPSGRAYTSAYKSWFHSASTSLKPSNVKSIDRENMYLFLPGIGVYLVETANTASPKDWSRLSGVTLYYRFREFRTRWRFGRGSCGGKQEP